MTINGISNLRKIWDNGIESPFVALRLDDIDILKARTGARMVVAFRWSYQGKEHETPFRISLLPDNSGFVHSEDGGATAKKLVVINADGTLRIEVPVPRVGEESKTEFGYLSLPPRPACFGGIAWGSEGNDGDSDYLFDFDWNSGKLLRYARPSRPW